MSLPILLSPEALSFWNSPIRDEREPFRASVVADAHLRATTERQAVEIYADMDGEPLEVVHPCSELVPCDGSPCMHDAAPMAGHTYCAGDDCWALIPDNGVDGELCIDCEEKH